MKTPPPPFFCFLTLAAAASFALAVPGRALSAPDAGATKTIGYQDTPMQPNGKWRVHDGTRPFPRVVVPPTSRTPSKAGTPPSDAIVLLGPGTDVSKWQTCDGGLISRGQLCEAGGPATWKMKNGVLESGKGFIRTADEFTDFQLHVEFATPKIVKGDGQGRGNSGVFLLGRYEVQVLDSYGNPTYPDGQSAALYGQYPPLVNASLPPGTWQTYDILFTAPRLKDGKLERPAIVTVLHNGVVVHNATAYDGLTTHRKILPYVPDATKGPIVLQDHGNPVHFRNIWIRPLKGYDE